MNSSNDTPSGTMAMPEAAITQELSLSIFTSLLDRNPKIVTLPWGKILEGLSNHKELDQKGGKAWSPVRYRPGSTRKRENVESIFMAVLDIDDGTPVSVLQEKLTGLEYVIYSTHSNTPEHPKYRVVIPFSEPVAAKDWAEIWPRLDFLVGGHADNATKDASRLYFFPTCPVGSKDHFVYQGSGKPLDPASLPPLPEPPRPSNVIPFKANNNASKQLGSAAELAEVVSRCQFMQYASDPAQQNGLSEPEWMAMTSNGSPFDDTDWIHAASCHHAGYDPEETGKRILRYREWNGPITCATIQSLGYEGCPKGGCKLPNKQATKSPAGLRVWHNWKSPDSPQEEQKKLALEQARAFAQAEYDGHIMHVNDSFQVYCQGSWQPINDAAIQQQLMHFLEQSGAKKITPASIKDVFEMLRMQCYQDSSVFGRPKSLICLENGTLDPLTGEMLAHDPAHMLTNRLAITWDSEANCPRWQQFLDEIFAPDPDKAEKIAFLQEWMGYCLIPDNSQHKFVWLVGRGGNGKSVVLEIIEALVGMQNISHAQIERLDRAAVRAELEGKLVNISSEMSAEATVADGYLKQIVGGDTIEAERKFKAPFSFKPYVRLICATNELPRLLDHSDGFARRAVILGFNRTFTEAEQDKTLVDQLNQEKPGILRWAVEGLQRLKQRGSFDLPPSSRAAVQEYRKDSDPVQLFLEECMVKDPNGMKPSDLYGDYGNWCRNNGFQVSNIIRFGKRLQKLGVERRKSGNDNLWLLKHKGTASESVGRTYHY